MNTGRRGRRRFIAGWIGGLLGMLTGRGRAQEPEPEPKAPRTPTYSGDPLTSHVRLGDPPVQPLDTMVLLERGDDNSGRAMTHEVLSLIHEERGRNSSPWTLYASLASHHEVGDACVVCSRLHKHGPGWSTGLHSEVFNHARAVALGVNIEMSSDYDGTGPTQVIGLNIQAVRGPREMQYGIQVHDGQGRFEKAVGLNGSGDVGLDLAGRFGVGIDAHDNDIRLNEGACVVLDGEGKIRVRYREGRVEFLNGDRCFGHLDVNTEYHAV
jgi:hypothetical protein